MYLFYYYFIILAYNFAKKGRRVVVLFMSIFLRNQSFSNARWFYAKKAKAKTKTKTKNKKKKNGKLWLEIYIFHVGPYIQRNFRFFY